ncbi:MAG: hypothetical protein H6729_01910 [Deltaproteobacteria bacterium]|nr:hypothetical protein [Deltaproteobacteria bacterium]
MKRLLFCALLSVSASFAASKDAQAYPYGADCRGWFVDHAFDRVGGTFAVIESRLHRVLPDGSKTLLEVSEDARWIPAGPNYVQFGKPWATAPLPAGAYSVDAEFRIYENVDVPPASEDALASWKDSDFFKAIVWDFEPLACEPPPPPPPPPPSGEPRTPGYWKNHPASWPVSSLPLGDEAYDQGCLLSLLDMPTRGDLRIKLLHHLIAAKLNILPNSLPYAGNVDPALIEDTIAAADDYLKSSGTTVECPAGTVTGPSPRGAEKEEVEAIKDALDAFNNGVDFGQSSSALQSRSSSSDAEEALDNEGEPSAGGCSASGRDAGGAQPWLIAGLFVLAIRRRRRCK